MNPHHFRDYIVRPTLERIGLYSPSAERLLMGTAIIESGLEYVRQHNGGPALGFLQMEPATHDDIRTYLDMRPRLRSAISEVQARGVPGEMAWNAGYAVAMARLKYWRDREPLPDPDDVAGLAAYWKRVYNTRLGAGKESKFVARYQKYVEPLYA